MSGPFVTCQKCGYGNVHGYEACENCGSMLPRQRQPSAERGFNDPFERTYSESPSYQEPTRRVSPSPGPRGPEATAWGPEAGGRGPDDGWGQDAPGSWDSQATRTTSRSWQPDGGQSGPGGSYGGSGSYPGQDSYGAPGPYAPPGRHSRDEQFGHEPFGRDSQFGNDDATRHDPFGRDDATRHDPFGRDGQFGRDDATRHDPFGYDPFANPAGVSVSVALRLPNGRSINLTPGDRLVLGRGKESPLAELATDNISRVHAVITVQRDGAFLTDEGSTNGTFLNGSQIQPRREYRLQGSTAISLGTDPPLRVRVEVTE